jgi:hypothetical protein
MPNIEIHGVKELVESYNIRDKIFKLTDGQPFQEEIVVTTIQDVCVDIDGKAQPFLRIVTDKRNELNMLVNCLMPLKIDIEILVLDIFIPAQKS